jgi:hypothetical protein
MKARLALLWGAIPLACMLFLADPASAECWTQTNGAQICGTVPEVLSSGTPVPIDTSHPLPVQVQAGGSAQPVSGAVQLLDSAGTNKAAISASGAVKVDNSAVTQPVSGTVTATSSGGITNPTSTLALPAATTAYTAGQLIANSATAGSVVVPSFAIANTAGGALIPRVRLSTNDATSTAWGSQTIQVDLWSAAPTFVNGDRGAWSPATGTGNHLAAYSCQMSAEYGDGAFAECAPTVGSVAAPKLASGTAIYWTLQAVTGSGVTGASKTFTLTAETLN